MEPLAGSRAPWLAVLGPAISVLALEAAGRGRKGMKMKLQHLSGISWGRQTLAKPPRAVAARPCLAPAWCHMADCLLPVPRPAQLSHSQVVVVLLKQEHRRWVPTAAQELHRISCQGLGKQRGCGREDRVSQGRECLAQHISGAQSLLPQPVGRLRSPAKPRERAAVVTHPLRSACRLPRG